jgi:hypothetical protein
MLKNTFCGKKECKFSSLDKNNEIYLILTIHLKDCSEKDQIMQK